MFALTILAGGIVVLRPARMAHRLSPAEKSSNGWFTLCCSRASSAMLMLEL